MSTVEGMRKLDVVGSFAENAGVTVILRDSVNNSGLFTFNINKSDMSMFTESSMAVGGKVYASKAIRKKKTGLITAKGFTPAIKKNIMKLHKSGKSMRSVAAELGLTYDSTRRHVMKNTKKTK